MEYIDQTTSIHRLTTPILKTKEAVSLGELSRK